MKRRKILFLVTEDWFFRSHFLALAERALNDGWDVAVATKLSGALDNMSGVRLIEMPFARGSLKPWDVGRQVWALRSLLDDERPDVVHAIALKPIALLLLAGRTGFGRVLAITGRGYVAVSRSPWAKTVSWRLRRMIRRALKKPQTVLLVENGADRAWVESGRTVPDAQVVTMPGAGVDLERFIPAPEPSSKTIVVGLVARLIWSKGVDLAIDAVDHLRKNGVDIVLHIAGAADPENPEHVSAADLDKWRSIDGVTMLGSVTDVSAFWAGTHIACLPSRGGEGLPRALIEAAACARPTVTTNVPGCADFVRDGETGLVVPPGASFAIAGALQRLAADKALRSRMGAQARALVETSYTIRHASDQAAKAWSLGVSRQVR